MPDSQKNQIVVTGYCQCITTITFKRVVLYYKVWDMSQPG